MPYKDPIARKLYQKEYSAKYYLLHREQVVLRSKERKASEKEACRAERRRYYEKHRGAILEKRREYRERNREAIAEKRREYYECNREEILARGRLYYNSYPDSMAVRKRKYRNACFAERAFIDTLILSKGVDK